ncbi:Hypothetical protein CINCED_3A002762 [Cinara cedri]|uniref:BTB domain-containing protein n=1 Tax=Cinara cedri TaxID=506608 RepID=A0A5E4MVB0_9HEMI|nr:Hypothetical protein CINCED_3A002762 [Cinara cedri]
MTNNHLNTISGQDQQYCLRWNNHQTNLTNVFVQLFQSEEFTDTTLFCEGGPPVKCHKMVLAACSSYFQSVFAEVPGKHSAVVLKDVGHAEMKAILDYMYKGEVNIAHDQLAALLKVAEMLKVKGLVQDNTSYQPQSAGPAAAAADEDRNIISTSSPNHVSPDGNTSASKDLAVNINNNNEHNDSPPHSTGISQQSPFYNKNYYGKSPPLNEHVRPGRSNVPMWPMPALQLTSPPVTNAMFGGSYDAMVAGHPGMSPLRRKKLSSMLVGRDTRDTPILRTVLKQGQADSSQQLPPIMYDSEAMEHHRPQSNGSEHSSQFSKIKMESYALAYPPDMSMNDDEEMMRMAKINNSSSPQSMYGDSKSGVVTPGIAPYVPSHKPEWKRYKQYTRQDIMSAIDAVRTGMSALQASRKFGVPSRTLYDKVKKLGQMSGAEDESGHSSAMEHATAGFLHHALGLSGVSMKSDHETSNNENSPHSDKMEEGGSPCSPELIKYAGHEEDTRSPPPTDNDDQAQDLSVSRKSESSMQATPTSRVIMAPISQTPSVPMLAAGNDDRD